MVFGFLLQLELPVSVRVTFYSYRILVLWAPDDKSSLI